MNLADKDLKAKGTNAVAQSTTARRPTALFAMITLLAVYVVAEAGFTYHEQTVGEPMFALIESTSDGAVRFDPVSGYRLSNTPHRVTQFMDGQQAFLSWHKGNAQGFPDDDDFHPSRTDRQTRRIVVLGDSFTEAVAIEVNWPNQAQRLARARGHRVEFLNTALAGSGLANWWSIVTNMLDREDYELDAIVIAVYMDDLCRRFLSSETRGYRAVQFGLARTWEPKHYPRTLEEARGGFASGPFYVVSTDEFDRLVARRRAPFRLALYGNARTFLTLLKLSVSSDFDLTDPERLKLVEDLATYVRQRKLRAYVAFIPPIPNGRSQDQLREWKSYYPIERNQDLERFVEHLGATLIDGTRMYGDRDSVAAMTLWNPSDGHFSQDGSDEFARLIVDTLEKDGALTPPHEEGH